MHYFSEHLHFQLLKFWGHTAGLLSFLSFSVSSQVVWAEVELSSELLLAVCSERTLSTFWSTYGKRTPKLVKPSTSNSPLPLYKTKNMQGTATYMETNKFLNTNLKLLFWIIEYNSKSWLHIYKIYQYSIHLFQH